MGWISKVKLGAPPHQCDLPGAMQIMKDRVDVGSVWQCSTCRTRYLYRGITMGVVDWEEGQTGK